MIVRTGDGVIHLITQPDHAALARRIMEHCVPLRASERHESILLAVGEHDNGWRELDEAPSVDAHGRVIDFIAAPTRPKQQVWVRGVNRVARDPYAAALIAQHAAFVYDRFRQDAEWSAFFTEMEALRDDLRRRTDTAHEDLLRDYAYVRVGDLISLTFCTAWIDEQRHEDWTVRRDGDDVHVTPELFDSATIRFEVGALELPDRAFASNDDFRHALAEAPHVTLTGALRTAHG